MVFVFKTVILRNKISNSTEKPIAENPLPPPGAAKELKEGDKGWLGAWWLGFVIVAALTALISPILGTVQ